MMRRRLATLERHLFPAGLERTWYAIIAHINARCSLGLDEATLQAMARQEAATGRDPGDVLAAYLARLEEDDDAAPS
jgi:hypothetical protein